MENPKLEPTQITTLKRHLVDVLNKNHRKTHTTPAAHLYPHQWLWDSAFIAIGLRHVDVKKAQTEIESIFRGQWSNGMVAHMIFDKSPKYRRDREMWASHLSPYSPGDYATTGITQPPMLAEAIWRVGEKLPKHERVAWFKLMLPKLISYHEWLFRDRDPHNSGLVLQVHPYETGLDNTPPWIIQLHEHRKPLWINAIEALKLDKLVNLIRRDTKHVPPGQRMSNIDALLYWDIIRKFRKKHWDTDLMLHRADFMIEDLSFNAIFTRSNQILLNIAAAARYKLPTKLEANIALNKKSFNNLYDENSGWFYSRDFVTRKPIEEPTIACLIALYSGVISHERATRLVSLLKDSRHFALKYPIPSVPLSSTFYDEKKYWQGPSWLNTNWLINDGLVRYGFVDESDELKRTSVEVLIKSSSYEYFSPRTGEGLGAKDFSWTAALGLDFIDT